MRDKKLIAAFGKPMAAESSDRSSLSVSPSLLHFDSLNWREQILLPNFISVICSIHR